MRLTVSCLYSEGKAIKPIKYAFSQAPSNHKNWLAGSGGDSRTGSHVPRRENPNCFLKPDEIGLGFALPPPEVLSLRVKKRPLLLAEVALSSLSEMVLPVSKTKI